MTRKPKLYYSFQFLVIAKGVHIKKNCKREVGVR